MAVKVLYFTGTGNSLYLAQKVAASFDGAELLPLVFFLKEGIFKPFPETVVLVFPLYHYGLPGIVKKFLEAISSKTCFYFSVIINAEYPDGLAIEQIKEILQDGNVQLQSAFYIRMPTNYLISSKMPGKRKIEALIRKADKKLSKIIPFIHNKRFYIEKEHAWYALIMNARQKYAQWRKNFKNNAESFHVSEQCTSCGICSNVCPKSNIRLENGRVTWGKECEKCLACLHHCPQRAINYGTSTQNKPRYINPFLGSSFDFRR